MVQQISAKPNTKQPILRQTKMAIPDVEIILLYFERSNFMLSPKLEITDFIYFFISSSASSYIQMN
jgi:hypothetical protein